MSYGSFEPDFTDADFAVGKYTEFFNPNNGVQVAFHRLPCGVSSEDDFNGSVVDLRELCDLPDGDVVIVITRFTRDPDPDEIKHYNRGDLSPECDFKNMRASASYIRSGDILY